MSYYDDGRYRSRRDRPSRQDGYADDGYVDNRVVYRKRRDSDDSVVEEVTRDFPPGDYGYPRRTRVTTVREGVRRARSVGRDPYYDGGYYRRDDYVAPPPRYSDRRDRDRDRNRDRDRDRDRDRYSNYSSSRSPSPRPKRRKSFSEQALGALGLGKLAAATRDNRDDRDSYYGRDYDRGYNRGSARDRGRSRSRRGYRSNSSSRSRSRRPRAKSEQRVAQAVKAALAAGAAEAFRARKDPGPWNGDKGKRILTAAITAGGVDGLVDRDPDKHGGRNVIESVLAGMATNHFINGPRSRSRGRNGRSQSRGGGGLKDIASAGVLAAAGKEIFDRVRSKSRGRDRSRSSSSDRGSRGGSRKRSSSVSKYINKGLAALGLDDNKKSSDGDRRRGGRSSRYSDEDSDYSDDGRSYRTGQRSSRDVGRPRSISSAGPQNAVTRTRAYSASGNGDSRGGRRGSSKSSSSDSDSDLGSSEDEKKEKRKMVRKEMLTTGLATVATIHAAHNVIKGIEGRKKRQEELRQGKISPEEARKKRIRSTAIDVATVGLAALGVKGAIGEWKEVNEKRAEHKEFMEKVRRHQEKRAQRRSQSVGGKNYYHHNDDDSGYGDGHGSGHGDGYSNGYHHGGHDYNDGNPLDGFGDVVDF